MVLQYICPSGTLMAGLPLYALNESLRSAAGFLYAWKVGILVALVVLSLFVYRPFNTRSSVPLARFMDCSTPSPFYRIRIDAEKCTHCGACTRACPMNVPVETSPNHPECIRCGACQQRASSARLSMGFARKKRTAPAKEAAHER